MEKVWKRSSEGRASPVSLEGHEGGQEIGKMWTNNYRVERMWDGGMVAWRDVLFVSYLLPLTSYFLLLHSDQTIRTQRKRQETPKRHV